MRKAQKDMALEFVQTLHEAHEEIKKQIVASDKAQAMDLLIQCQQGAIALGDLIEKAEGEDTQTEKLLIQYCEMVYHVYEELANSEVGDSVRIYATLHKQAIKIENSIRQDIPLRREVAFFPYKASMWDALESVYLAAKADPDCDVYCVPIPYFDRKSDGSLGRMHYEGREYPENIEVIDWKTYNFEERKPDVIYIHNPYDDCNLVTCVHPRYFSSNLKKYTDKLVYIPYFVLQEIDPQDQETIEKMKHFCFLPGTVNADKVIVQSENMRQIYINEYLKAAKANHLQGAHVDRKQLEQKILGLGSPKFDKVLNTKKEDLEIPKEWLRIIRKPDGSWKKIILYNTSIAALLEQDGKMLEKMIHVFRTFKENQNEVALLWRPHPLIPSAIQSMRPGLWAIYEKIVKQYREEGWGIYDDTADMDRAVVLSDGYYGDWSSVMDIYVKLHKPIMIQNVINRTSNKDEFIFGKGMHVDDDFIWIPMAMAHSLAKIDKRTGKIKEYYNYGNIYLDEKWKNYLYTDIVQEDNLLFLAPTRSEVVAIFNKNNQKIEKIPVNIPKDFAKYIGSYDFAIKERKYIFFVGICNTNAIGRMNIFDKRIVFFGQNFKEMKIPVYGRNSVTVNNKIYIPLMWNGCIYSFDLNTEKEEVMKVDSKGRKLITINCYNNWLYITTEDGQLLKTSCNGEVIKEMEMPGHRMYYCSASRNEFLWLFPLNIEDGGIKMNLRNNHIERFDVNKIVYSVEEDKGEFVLNAKGCMLKLDNENGIETMQYFFEEAESMSELVQKCNGEGVLRKILFEGNPDYLNLDIFLNIICNKEYRAD